MTATQKPELTDAVDPGSPLDPAYRGRLEHLFDADLSEVLVHRSPVVDALNAATGSLAFAVGRGIYMASPVDRAEGPIHDFVVAHEVAHILQKRHGCNSELRSSCADVWLLEAEATRAARDIMAGRKARVTLTDDPRAVRHWGPAGHYWTVFFTALAAGVPELEAYSSAFYTQLPDQVRELDAVPRGIETQVDQSLISYDESVVAYDRLSMSLRPWLNPWEKALVSDEIQRLSYDAHRLLEEQHRNQIVQRGLHCLAGRPAQREYDCWRRRLTKYDPHSFEFKLALHAFGDCFAHRMGNGFGATMYIDPNGHGLDSLAGHSPDDIHTHLQNYFEYTGNLYDLFVEKWHSDARLNKLVYIHFMEEVASKDTEDAQIAFIKSAIEQPAKFARTSRFRDDGSLELVTVTPDDVARSEQVRREVLADLPTEKTVLLADKSLLAYDPNVEFSGLAYQAYHQIHIDSIPWEEFYPRHSDDKDAKKRSPALSSTMLNDALRWAEQWANGVDI